jgi:hypothetical protein
MHFPHPFSHIAKLGRTPLGGHGKHCGIRPRFLYPMYQHTPEQRRRLKIVVVAESKFFQLFRLLGQTDIVRYYCRVCRYAWYGSDGDSDLHSVNDGLLYYLNEKAYVVINTLLDL